MYTSGFADETKQNSQKAQRLHLNTDYKFQATLTPQIVGSRDEIIR